MSGLEYMPRQAGGFRLLGQAAYLEEAFLRTCCTGPEVGPAGGERVGSSPAARVYRFTFAGRAYYQKWFLPRGWLEFVRDAWYGVRAERARRGHVLLERWGFATPAVVLVGWRGPDSFMVTPAVEGAVRLREFLEGLAGPFEAGRCAPPIALRRRAAAALGCIIGRLHACRIAAGDLGSGNLFIWDGADGQVGCIFLDNERTLRYRRLPERARLKNLVQMNKLSERLASRTDRWRFWRAYLAENPCLQARQRQWVRRVRRGTEERAQRRRERRRRQGQRDN